ncbi:MAG: hypothetical protein J6Y97_00455 [Prevotella sp.]|nr:hypothetical protein [Prevotella sp.]MBP5506831.1 hypothetical protein [Prevotella sp.]
MKKIYLTPVIRIQAIDSEDVMANSMEGAIPTFDNPVTKDTELGTTDPILTNGASIWDIEED